MSGKPSIEGVREFKEVLDRFRDTGNRIANLRVMLESTQKALEEATEQYSRDSRILFELLSRMDVYSSGNTGYEHRMAWFLKELSAQCEGGVHHG